jgi:hypothetical protein
MDNKKIFKYKNLKPKFNPQVHEFDQNYPKFLLNYFRHKSNKLYHKIEILCKFPELSVKDWMNIKLNNKSFYNSCHHFPIWLESLLNSPHGLVANIKLETFRIHFHTIYINNQLDISLKHKKDNQGKFKNRVIRQTNKYSAYEYLKHPFTRKLMKMYSFNELKHDELYKYSYLLQKKRKYLYLWKVNRIKKIQKIEFDKMQLLKLQAPYLLQPFADNWQFNIWLIDFQPLILE